MYQKLWKANLPVLVLAASAFGQQQPAQPQGNVATGGDVPVEYSNNLDEMAIPGGGAHNGLDSLQVLYTEPPDGPGLPFPMDIIDFGSSGEVDALANNGDFLFFGVMLNTADLLVSFLGDPPNPPGIAVYGETPPGAVGVWALQADLSNPDPPGDVEDVDGLELWGPFGASDANMFSLVGDPGGFSVYYFPPPAGPAVGYVPKAVIAAAVAPFCGAVDPDLDALMVFDLGGWFDGVWNAGDRIIFSIRAAGGCDGGEIWVLPFGGLAAFLVHGGHVWNTAFPVGATFGVPTEEVDAIEAYPADKKSWLPGACCDPADLPGVACVPSLTFAECGALGGHWRVGAPCGAAGECIPTVSEWGVVVMAMLVLTAGTIVVMRRRAAVA